MPTIFQLINKREYAENAMLARQEVKIEDIRNVARKKIAKGASLAYAILIESKEVARNSYNELRLVLCCVVVY
jgi:UDP-3-O-acyl-N-acetylglucosamine deacetylase